jgi:hypothetical protein
VLLIATTKEPHISPTITRDAMFIAQWLLQNYVGCFAFNLKELSQLKGHKVYITLEDDTPNFR